MRDECDKYVTDVANTTGLTYMVRMTAVTSIKYVTDVANTAQLNLFAFGDSAVTVKSLYKPALHQISLGGAVVRANIYKLYLLHSHARNSLINQVIY